MSPSSGYKQISQVNSILEWGRLNVDLIDMMMQRLLDLDDQSVLDSVWYNRTITYDGLRIIHRHLMTTNTYQVQIIESVMQRANQRVQHDAEQLVKKRCQDGSSYENQKRSQQRADLFSSLNSGEKDHSHVARHQQVYDKVPGDNHARNRKWMEKRKQKRLARKSLGDFVPDHQFKARRKQDLREKLTARSSSSRSSDTSASRSLGRPMNNSDMTSPSGRSSDSRMEASRSSDRSVSESNSWYKSRAAHQPGTRYYHHSNDQEKDQSRHYRSLRGYEKDNRRYEDNHRYTGPDTEEQEFMTEYDDECYETAS